jgi:hypothetical protein
LAAREKGIRSVSIQGDKIVAVRRGEDIRPGGRYPRITKRTSLDMLSEIREKIGEL